MVRTWPSDSLMFGLKTVTFPKWITCFCLPFVDVMVMVEFSFTMWGIMVFMNL